MSFLCVVLSRRREVDGESRHQALTLTLSQKGEGIQSLLRINPINNLAILFIDDAALYFQRWRQLAAFNRQFVGQQRDPLDLFELCEALRARGNLALEQINDPRTPAEFLFLSQVQTLELSVCL